MLVPCSSTKQPRHILRSSTFSFSSPIPCSTISASFMACNMEFVLLRVWSIKVDSIALPQLLNPPQPLAFSSQFLHASPRLQSAFVCHLSFHKLVASLLAPPTVLAQAQPPALLPPSVP